MTTTDADSLGDTKGAQIGDHNRGLNSQFNGCRAEDLSAPNNDAPLATNIALPTPYIKVMCAINLQNHTSPILELPFGIEIAQPPARVETLHLPVRHLDAKAAADTD
jgi:hypothetical protein